MVSIDFRLEYGVTNEQVHDLLRSIGYTFIKTKKKAVKKGNKRISADEFIKVAESGRVHVFVEFSTKNSGTEAYPQIDIHAHYDYFKIEGDKLFHVTRRNIRRDLDEMYLIHDALKEQGYGYMEYKSQNSAHNTFRSKLKPLLVEILKKNYKYDKDGKYKKPIPNGQITFQIVEQRRFSHTVCVHATGIKHVLSRDKALEESNRIMDELEQILTQNAEKIEKLKIKNVELYQKSLTSKQERDSLNLKTQEMISSIQEIQQKSDQEKNPKKKKTPSNKKKAIEKKLIANKKLADKKHEEYIQLKKEAAKIKKRLKKLKKLQSKNK